MKAKYLVVAHYDLFEPVIEETDSLEEAEERFEELVRDAQDPESELAGYFYLCKIIKEDEAT